MMRTESKALSAEYRMSGHGNATEQRKSGQEFRWTAHPLTEADYEWLRHTDKGWTQKKFAYHGMEWPPPQGWRKKLLDSRFGVEDRMSKKQQRIDVAKEMLSMKKLYQEKSGDYSY